MKAISHRGNLNGKITYRENTTSYVNEAIKAGYDVEIDVMFKNNDLWLGHDEPDEKVTLGWLLLNRHMLWLHCKDLESMMFISKHAPQMNYFGHSGDPFVLTSRGYIFCLPSHDLDASCVLVMPEHFNFTPKSSNDAYAVLTDYPTSYKDKQWRNSVNTK